MAQSHCVTISYTKVALELPSQEGTARSSISSSSQSLVHWIRILNMLINTINMKLLRNNSVLHYL